MPGANNGTGQPFCLRCAKCKRREPRRFEYDRDLGMNLEATGRVRPLKTYQHGTGGPRVLQYRGEYRCLDCGHIGWSRHVDVERLLTLKGRKVRVDLFGEIVVTSIDGNTIFP